MEKDKDKPGTAALVTAAEKRRCAPRTAGRRGGERKKRWEHKITNTQTFTDIAQTHTLTHTNKQDDTMMKCA